MKFGSFFKSLADRLHENTKPLSDRDKWLLLFLFGVLLAVIVFPMEKKQTASKQETQTETQTTIATAQKMNMSQYEAYLSKQLEMILQEMDGVGQVQAWVTLESGEEKVLYQEKNSKTSKLEEADSVGGTRVEESQNVEKTTVVDSGGNPYIIKTIQPKVEGVLVLAEGADDSEIKKNIMEAVEVLFGIDVHRIKVAKKKVEE